MKVICLKGNEHSRVEDQQDIGVKYFVQAKKIFETLADFNYAQINSKFRLLCHKTFPQFCDIDSGNFKNEDSNAIQRNKNGLLNFCSHLKNDAKKLFAKLKITKKIKESNQKILKIPRVVRNSICERKKKLSISKNRIKRKSIIMIKSILNEVKSNSKVLTPKQSQLQSLALKAKELRTIDHNDCTKTISSKPTFISPIIPCTTSSSFDSSSKYQTAESCLFTSAVQNYSVENALFKTASETFFKKEESHKVNIHFSLLTNDDYSDDENNLEKPIPEWAKRVHILNKANYQAVKQINFTRLFSAAMPNHISLDNVFKIKKKRFNQRTSSADWTATPRNGCGGGLSGEMSYLALKTYLNSE